MFTPEPNTIELDADILGASFKIQVSDRCYKTNFKHHITPVPMRLMVIGTSSTIEVAANTPLPSFEILKLSPVFFTPWYVKFWHLLKAPFGWFAPRERVLRPRPNITPGGSLVCRTCGMNNHFWAEFCRRCGHAFVPKGGENQRPYGQRPLPPSAPPAPSNRDVT